MTTPSALWLEYLEAAGPEGAPEQQNTLWYKTVERTLWPRLQKEGFAAPHTRSLMSTLEAGLEPLPEAPSSTGMRSGRVCSFDYFLNLLWDPILKHIEALSRDEDPQWTQSLGLNQASILSEMHGIVPGADVALDMDHWVEFIQRTLGRLL